METRDRPLVWLHGEIKTPPFSMAARVEVGELLRRLQMGESLGMPHPRPMPGIGRRCHELRVLDQGATWRVAYRTDNDAIVVLAVFGKTTRATSRRIIEDCKRRLARYDAAASEE